MRRKRPGFIHVDATDIAFLQEAGMDALLHAARCCRDAGIVYQLSISPLGKRMLHFADPSQLSDVRIGDKQLPAEKNRRPRSIGGKGDQPLAAINYPRGPISNDVELFERKETVDDASIRGRPMDLSGCSLLL
jgi:hypothetical protein